MKKQMKFLTLALALFVGMTLTSCLNSDDNTTSTMSTIVKVQGSFYGTVSFVAQDGYTIEPSQESYYQTVANGIEWEQYYGKIIQLIYSYDTTSADVVIDEDGISGVTLQSLASLDSPVEIVTSEGAQNDSIANMPIIELGDGNSITPMYWDSQTLILPINYYIYFNGYSLNAHTFTLEYHAYEPYDGTLRLYLEHNKQKDNPTTQMTSYQLGLVSGYYRAFDLRQLQAYFSGQQGQPMPTNITIVTREDDYALDLTDDIPTKEYVVTYTGTN